MFNLPITTEIKKQLPKKSVFAKCDLTAQQRNAIDADIARIDIVGYVSSDTVRTLVAGKTVSQFYVFTAQLKNKAYNSKSIELLFKAIPQRFVLALQHGGQTQLVAYHTRLIVGQWQPTENVSISITGLNLDTAWDNIVAGIGNIDVVEGNTLTQQIVINKEQTNIKAQISALEKRLSKEKQLTVKMEIKAKIRELKKQIN